MMQTLRRHRRSAIAGLLWGLAAPLIGLYLGLAVNVTIGTVLTLPWIALSAMMDQGMLELPPAVIVLAFLLSGMVWSTLSRDCSARDIPANKKNAVPGRDGMTSGLLHSSIDM